MNIRFGVLTVSDRSSRGERLDASGPLLAEAIRTRGWSVNQMMVIPDDFDLLKKTLETWADSNQLDIILTTGGTGFAPRDITPEATLAVIDRLVPGIPEAMRADGLKVNRHAMLSRMAAGIRQRTLIINLPGSPKAAMENFEVVHATLEHAVQLIRGDPESEHGHLATIQ